jgi:hypothetical protein
MGAFKDLTGQKFGKLRVLEFIRIRKSKSHWKCECECGTIVIVEQYNLTKGHTKSCGCLRHRYNDLTGQRFGRLTVLGLSEEKFGHNPIYWRCLCSCGKIVEVRGGSLTSGHTVSCGCFQKEVVRNAFIIHGMSGTKIGETWEGIKARCYKEDNKSYKNYGGRGIYICDEWLEDPPKFFTWAENSGYIQGLRIDRIDNDGPYSPENCRWTTNAENQRNKRNNHFITYKGKTQCLAAWSRDTGIPVTTIDSRLRRGCSVEEALSPINNVTGLPSNTPALITIRGESLIITDWLKKTGTNKSTYYGRLKKGFTPEQILFP